MVDGVDHLLNWHPVNLALDATGLREHGPVVHRDKLVFCRLAEHTLYALGVFVVNAHNLGSTRQPGDARVDLVKFVKLILREDVVRARQEIAASQICR